MGCSSSLNKLEISSRGEVQLKNAVKEYMLGLGNQENRRNLLVVLQNNDFHEAISDSVGGDEVSDAFVRAGFRNHLDILQAFLDCEINVNVKDRFGRTALIQSCYNNHEEAVGLLLGENADANVQNNDGWTALMYASQFGYIEIVQLLLDHGADTNLKNDNGRTALDLASVGHIKDKIKNRFIYCDNNSYVLK